MHTQTLYFQHICQNHMEREMVLIKCVSVCKEAILHYLLKYTWNEIIR